MIRFRSILQWFVLVGILLLIPEESRLAVFDTRPADWYGEVVLSHNDGMVVVAKNSANRAVALGLDSVESLVMLQEEEKVAYAVPHSDVVLPHSVAVARVPETVEMMEARILTTEENHYFRPLPLTILTRADLWSSYWLGATLVGAFLVLGFLLARLHTEDVSHKDDR